MLQTHGDSKMSLAQQISNLKQLLGLSIRSLPMDAGIRRLAMIDKPYFLPLMIGSDILKSGEMKMVQGWFDKISFKNISLTSKWKLP